MLSVLLCICISEEDVLETQLSGLLCHAAKMDACLLSSICVRRMRSVEQLLLQVSTLLT